MEISRSKKRGNRKKMKLNKRGFARLCERDAERDYLVLGLL